jgi:integrase
VIETCKEVPMSQKVKRYPVFDAKGHRITGLWLRKTAKAECYELRRRDENGVDRRVPLKARTKGEAIREHRALTTKLDDGTAQIGNRSLTLGQLRDDFIAREQGPLAELAPRTAELYAMRTRRVIEILGPNMKAADVKPSHMRKVIDALRREGRAGSTIRGTVYAASAMFAHGRKRLDLQVDPLRGLERGKRGDLPSAARQSEPRYLDVAQVEKLFDKLSEETRPIVFVLYYGAARVSECLGLTWADVDFEDRELHLQGTKSESSDRVIPLHPRLVAELKAHRQRVSERPVAPLAPSAPIFTTKGGKVPTRQNVRRAIAAAATVADKALRKVERETLDEKRLIGHLHPHDLRHTRAARMIAGGMNIVEVSRFLGHANPQITLRIYAGIADSGIEAMAAKAAAID